MDHRHIQTLIYPTLLAHLSRSPLGFLCRFCCIKLCPLLPLSYFRFRSIPSLYHPMFIWRSLSSNVLARRIPLSPGITLRITFIIIIAIIIVRSLQNPVVFHRPRVRAHQCICTQFICMQARRTIACIERGHGWKRMAKRVTMVGRERERAV